MRERVPSMPGGDRQAGNILLMAVFLTIVMTALSSAQFMIVHKNIRQSEFYAARETLTSYAESGLQIALHDLRFLLTVNEGAIGTVNWNALADDLGGDGTANTGDEGEGDGIPTVGEPNVNPVQVGENGDEAQLIVYSEDTGWANVKRVVATASNSISSSSVEAYTLQITGQNSVPRVAPVYVEPTVVLDLKGAAFLIDGNDHNPDGSPGPDPAVYGLATMADPAIPGQNMNDLLDQIPPGRYSQIVGYGSTPSVGETSETIDINALFYSFTNGVDRTVAAGTYTSVTWGTSGNYEVTLVEGDVRLSGIGSGAGVLLVDGNVTFAGAFEYEGMIIARGDVRQVGGGSSVHLWGSMMVGQSITVLDVSDVNVLGNAELRYSSMALDEVDAILASIPGQGLEVLYWSSLR